MPKSFEWGNIPPDVWPSHCSDAKSESLLSMWSRLALLLPVDCIVSCTKIEKHGEVKKR